MKALFIGGTGTISMSVTLLALKRGWDVTLLNRGSKPVPDGMDSIVADIHDEEAVAAALEGKHYDVVAQFIGFTAEDVMRDIRLFKGKTKQYIYISSASAYQKPVTDHRITESTPLIIRTGSTQETRLRLRMCCWQPAEGRDSRLPLSAPATPIMEPSRRYAYMAQRETGRS